MTTKQLANLLSDRTILGYCEGHTDIFDENEPDYKYYKKDREFFENLAIYIKRNINKKY